MIPSCSSLEYSSMGFPSSTSCNKRKAFSKFSNRCRRRISSVLLMVFPLPGSAVLLVINDLLHSPAGADAESLQFDLGSGNTVDQEHHVVAMVAVFGVDTELVNDLEGVFTPV